ncbi:MAG: carboxypeptidase regulatory-like domain-containing protein [Bacteroidales bacterium]|nr:carboxypeptidase regulatory-like domain-containing protein [Bacteroidales bacterium]
MSSISRTLFLPITFLGIIISSTLFTSCGEEDYDIYSSIYGVVTDYETGETLSNVSVILSPSSKTARTGTDGTFLFEELESQQYTITVQKSGYQPNRKTVTAISGETSRVDISMTKIPEN